MNYSKRRHLRGLTYSLLSFGSIAALGCSAESTPGTHDALAGEAVSATSQPVWPDSLLEKTLVRTRSLETPGNVYLTSIEQRVDAGGTFSQTFYVYQPDANGESISFELSAKTSTGATDGAHQFQSVTVTSRPGQADQTTQTLWNSVGNAVYYLATSRQGWYKLQFTYVAPNAGRTLGFRAFDVANNSLQIVWSDPPSAPVRVKASARMQQAGATFFKGGAYRNATSSQSAFADNVTVDGKLLYRRSFDQGSFDFPLGWLSAGSHTLEFTLQASAYPAKFWFGVSDKTFDPTARRSAWNSVQMLYYGETHTSEYDAWNEGVAFAQGPAPGRGVRPAPIRRGTSLGVALDHASLNGSGSNATLRVFPYGSSTQLNWTATRETNGDYAGGIYTNSGFSTRYREHWRVAVPATASVGRYVLRAFTPGGAQIGEDVAFYVIYNPYSLVANGRLSKPELDTFAYDEDEDGVNMFDAPYGADANAKRHHFTAIYYGQPSMGQFSPDSKVTGSFRRTGDDPLGLSALDYAMAAADGTASEFDSMRRVLRLTSQQFRYGGSDISDDTAGRFVSTVEEPTFPWSLEGASFYSRPGNELTDPAQAICYTMASILPAYARALGIPSRSVTATGLGGWAEHAFAEVFIPDLPRHGGTQTSNATSPNSDTDPWYVFDATDPGGNGNSPTWKQYSQAIAPRAQYGRAYQIINGFSDPFYATTTPVIWDYDIDGTSTTNALSVTSSYASGPDYWLSRSGITGWLGYWEKDVYRVSKSATGATSVSVRMLPNDGEYLTPKLCVVPVTANPALPERCASPATSVVLPPGESYVVVFNDGAPVQQFRGDSVQYILELQ